MRPKQVLCLALTMAGCRTEPTSGDPVEISEDDAAERYAAAACAWARGRDGCPSWDDCEGTVSDVFAAAQAQAQAEGRSFDAICLQSHLDVLAENKFFYEADGCSVYPGGAQAGEGCAREAALNAFSSCSEGLACRGHAPACEPLDGCGGGRTLMSGEPCRDGNGCPLGECEGPTPSYCAETQVCAPAVAVGEACTDDHGCSSGSCDAGTCVAWLAAGEPCARASQCSSQVCAAGTCGAQIVAPAGCSARFP